MAKKRRIGLHALGALAAAVAAGASQAHECRKLGSDTGFGNFADDMSPGYWVCLGFGYEDGFRPAAGYPENLDFLTAYWDPKYDNGDGSFGRFLDVGTEEGDDVKITAKILYLNDTTWNYWDTTTDPPDDKPPEDPTKYWGNWLVVNPPKRAHVGWDSPAEMKGGKLKFEKVFAPVDFEEPEPTPDGVVWRLKKDFMLPYKGMYAWVVDGVIKKKGKPPITISTKFTCGIPRLHPLTTNPDTGQVYPPDRGLSIYGLFDCALWGKDKESRAALGSANHTGFAPVKAALAKVNGQR
ncbi:MAG: hypothetical protein U1E83_01720 [Methylotetracoccus sp.]